MQNSREKNLIIVHEKQAKQGAEFLGGLLGEMSASGIQVNALIVDAKEFASYPAERKTANQKIIFLGNFPESSLAGKSIYKWRFHQHGIRYGWHGNRCVIDFDKKLLTEDDFKEMIAFAENEIEEYGNYSFCDKVEKRGLNVMQGIEEQLHKSKKNWWRYVVGGVPRFLTDTVVGTVKDKDKLNLVQMKEQQQNIATLHFFLNHFEDFMGFKEGNDGEV